MYLKETGFPGKTLETENTISVTTKITGMIQINLLTK